MLFLFLLVGCERNYERTIWINPDVECCGVKDPLNNIEWLKWKYDFSYFDEDDVIYRSYYYYIYIFKSDSTNEEFIVTRENIINEKKPEFVLYSCNGEIIDKGYYQDYDSEYANPDIHFVTPTYYEIKPCYSCDEFFKTHTLVDTIAYVYTNDFAK